MSNWVYFQNKIVPKEEAKICVTTQSLHYGTSCFGGIRGYWNQEEEQLYIFRPQEHYQRFLNSSKILMQKITHSVNSLVEVTRDLVKKEEWKQDIYIRPLAYVNTEGIACQLHDMTSDVVIFSFPFGKYLEKDMISTGISSWRRLDDNVIPVRGKIGGAYVNSALIKTEAYVNGYDEGIVLTQDGHVAEGSAENIFMVKNNKVITPPVTDNILEGITRNTIIRLCQDYGYEVIERSIDRSELYCADELFMCGTGVQIVSIVSVDQRMIGNGEQYPVTDNIKRVFYRVVRGLEKDYLSWCIPVYE